MIARVFCRFGGLELSKKRADFVLARGCRPVHHGESAAMWVRAVVSAVGNPFGLIRRDPVHALSQRWDLLMMRSDALQCTPKSNHGFICERFPDQLQTDWQASPRASDRNGQRRETEIVDRPRKPRDRCDDTFSEATSADLAFRDGRCCHAGDWRDDNVYIADGREMGCQRRATPTQSFQILHSAVSEPILQARSHFGPIISGLLTQPRRMHRGGLDSPLIMGPKCERAVDAATAHAPRRPRPPERSVQRH